jgi:hypothetical protein
MKSLAIPCAYLGGAGTSAAGTTTGSSGSRASVPPCENEAQCSTQTAGQLIGSVTISDPSDPVSVDSALIEYTYSTIEKSASILHVAVNQTQCAPAGSIGEFPKNDYMCGGIEVSTINGQRSLEAIGLFNVRPDGAVYYVGGPCDESAGSTCIARYWSLVQAQFQTTAETKAAKSESS